MTVVIVGLREVQEMMYAASNFLGSRTEASQEVLWETGLELRRQCQLMCDVVVYSTPETPKYRRTGYLRESMYVTIQGRSDWREAHARAFALAAAMYPRPSTITTYRLARPISRPPERNAVKVSSGAVYADFVEFGSGNNNSGPRPYMREGSAAGARQVIAVAERMISRELSNIARRQNRDARGRFTR